MICLCERTKRRCECAMKKLFAAVMVLVFALPVFTVSANAYAEAAYEDGAERYVSLPDGRLFRSVEAVCPGADITGTIIAENKGPGEVRLYIRGEVADASHTAAANKLSLSVFDSSGRMCSGSAASDTGTVTGNTYICTLAEGEKKEYRFRLHISRKMPAESASIVGNMRWVFKAESAASASESRSSGAADVSDGGESDTAANTDSDEPPADDYEFQNGYYIVKESSAEKKTAPKTEDMRGGLFRVYSAFCGIVLLSTVFVISGQKRVRI